MRSARAKSRAFLAAVRSATSASIAASDRPPVLALGFRASKMESNSPRKPRAADAFPARNSSASMALLASRTNSKTAARASAVLRSSLRLSVNAADACQLDLGQRFGIADIERLADGARFIHGPDHRRHQIVDVDELHEAVAVAGDDDGAAGAQAVPDELLAVIVRPWTVDKRRAEGDYRQTGGDVQSEKHALRGGLVAGVSKRMVVGRQRIALLVIQAVAVGGDARHEDVAGNAVPAGTYGGLHLGRRGAAFKIVNIVEYHVETTARQDFVQRFGVVAIGHQVLDPASEVVLRFAVQDGDVVAFLKQLLHQQFPDEESSSDYQHFHRSSLGLRRGAGGSDFIRAEPVSIALQPNNSATNRNIPGPNA